jgi:lipoprotein NlpI
LAQQRSGENGSSDLRQNAANVDLEKWPAQFIRLYLGDLDPDQVLLSMPTGNTRYNKERLCEAYFFLGEYHLIQGNNSRAADFFENALKTNIYYFIEYIAAKVELERMGSNSAAHNSWPISAIVAHARPAR